MVTRLTSSWLKCCKNGVKLKTQPKPSICFNIQMYFSFRKISSIGLHCFKTDFICRFKDNMNITWQAIPRIACRLSFLILFYHFQSTHEPKPGGKVVVKRQACRFADAEFQVKDHRHIRHAMVEELPEFDRVQRSRVVLQHMLRETQYTWLVLSWWLLYIDR